MQRLLLAAKARAAHGKKDHKDTRKTGSGVKRMPSKVHQRNHFGRLESLVSNDSRCGLLCLSAPGFPLCCDPPMFKKCRDIVDLLTERMHTLKSLGSIDALTDEHIAHMKDRVQVCRVCIPVHEAPTAKPALWPLALECLYG